jgi:hypothetical protein
MELASVLSDGPQPSQTDKLPKSEMNHLFFGSGPRELHGLGQKLFVEVDVRMRHKLPPNQCTSIRRFMCIIQEDASQAFSSRALSFRS